MSARTDIRSLDLNELTTAVKELGLPSYRAAQIYKWLWQKGARAFSEMTDLPQDLRIQLAEKFEFNVVVVDQLQKSSDGTLKCAFRLHDGNRVEGVLIPTASRATACISSQVGCSLNCKFCATGYLERQRNLTAAEIYDQVLLLNALALEHEGHSLDNIVYMGMGEPLLNYREVMRSVELICSEEGMHMSAQRLTISTAGIVKMIEKMADEKPRFNLALSLHAATDEKRSAIMPINETNDLEKLAAALKHWYEQTKTRPTLEYTVIEGVNDSESDMVELAAFARKFPCKINLIEYNPISQASFRSVGSKGLEGFAAGLTARKLIVNIRRSRGRDIDAACGQLVNKS